MRRGTYTLVALPLAVALTGCSLLSRGPSRQDLLNQLVNYRVAAAELNRTVYPNISAACEQDTYNDACVQRFKSFWNAREGLIKQGAQIVKKVGEIAAVQTLGQGYNPDPELTDEWVLRDMIREATGEWPQEDWY